ncbi:Rha family transcriptional regulator [Phascolarctobacterium faecium]|uniref:Rha family transcriptional regulator n=1 Tax=Phascolarctobacterium faecium TaxID=33025 RepID=UPI00242EEA4F|nr:Rha family transcriptional regulator [Phascolarctobacterium faecium]
MNNINHLTLDSREVAVMLEKEHNHLLRDISVYAKYLTETKIGLSDFFQESTYKDITGRTLKKYQITKKGCEFLAHKQTGRKGSSFTASYINRFHEMEAQLSKKPLQQTLIEEPYKPTLKYWKGVPVLTKLDVAMILNVDASSIQNYIRRPWFMTENVDFYFLRGHDLFEYRRENKIKSTIAALIVLTESGVRKIYEARNRKFTPAELFPVKSSCEPQRPMLVNAPMNIELQKKIKDLEGKLIALHEVLNLYNRCNTSEKSRCFANTLNELGLQIFSNIRAISDVKLTSYDNYEIGFRLGNMITR